MSETERTHWQPPPAAAVPEALPTPLPDPVPEFEPLQVHTPWEIPTTGAGDWVGPGGCTDHAINHARHEAFVSYVRATICAHALWLLPLLQQPGVWCFASCGMFFYKVGELYFDVPLIADQLRLLPWRESDEPNN